MITFILIWYFAGFFAMLFHLLQRGETSLSELSFSAVMGFLGFITCGFVLAALLLKDDPINKKDNKKNA